MFREVVITGLGRVGPQGPGRAILARALRECTPVPTRRFTTSPPLRDGRTTGETVDFAGWVEQIEPFGKIKTRNRSSLDPVGRTESLAREAARLARREAGLSEENVGGSLWIASSLGFPSSRLAQGDVGNQETWHRWLAATGTLKIGGTVSLREVSGLVALAEAASAIHEGRTDRAIVIEVDSVTPKILRVHRRLRALASGVGGSAPVARPFDRFRRGAVLAEGATAIVLERECVALDRQARPRSRVGAEFRTFDSSASPYGFGTGARALGAELGIRLRADGIDPRTIDGIISGARGSIEGDAQEANWIEALYEDKPHPPVFAPIGTTGLGGGGLLAAACLAAEGTPLCGSAGFLERDPKMTVRPHPSAVSPTPGRILLSTIASGGQAAWILFDAR